MNSVILDIGLLRYILITKYEIISICLIKQFHKQCDYRYWTIRYIYDQKFKIFSIYLITRFHE